MFGLALLLCPIAEAVVFVLVARATSWSTAFLLTLATSFIGSCLLRSRRRLENSEFTSRSLENYVYSNLGAFALLLPGFITDVFGFVVLIPPARRAFFTFLRWIGLDLYKNSNGLFSVFKMFSFGDHSTSADEPIDVESREPESSEDVYESSSYDSEPIDVEFTVRD